jgi:hypothetical protein
VAELGERLCSSASVSLLSKPFQKYYRNAREGRSGHLDENLAAESMAAMRLLVSFSAKEVAAVLPVMDPAGVTDSVKGFVKPSTLMLPSAGVSQPEPGCENFNSSYLALIIDSGSKGSRGGRDSLPLRWWCHSNCWKG